MKLKILAGALAIILSLQSGKLYAQSLSDLLADSRHEMSFKKGVLSGPGYNWIESKAATSSFLLFGETHRIKEIPQIVTSVYKQLYGLGYEYLAVEMGPWMGKHLSSPDLLGRKSKVNGQVTRYPSAIAFSYDQELTMLAQVGRQFRDTGKGQAIWGLDNAFGGEHLLKRLRALAPDETSKEFANKIYKKARKEKDGHEYISNASHWKDFQRLRSLYNPARGSESAQLIELLQTSNNIFYNWRLAYRIKKDRLTAYANRKEREEFMKNQFLKHYKAAKDAGAEQPKVIFKFGSAHIEPGIAPNLVTTLGNFVREFSVAEGTQSTTIAIYCHNKKTCNQLENKDLAPLARLVGGKITLFDFSSIKSQVLMGDYPELTPTLKRYILRNDALILIPNSKQASIKTIIWSRILNVF